MVIWAWSDGADDCGSETEVCLSDLQLGTADKENDASVPRSSLFEAAKKEGIDSTSCTAHYCTRARTARSRSPV